MANTDTSITGWTRTARWLHWGTAIAILVEVPVGYVMARTYGPGGVGYEDLHITASQIHHTIGLLMIAAFFFRAGWRIAHPAPPLPATVGPWEARLAGIVAFLLYSLLLLIPLSGWLALSSLADVQGIGPTQIWFLTHDGFGPGGQIPRLLPAVPYDSDHWYRYSTWGAAHRYMIYAGGLLLVLHIGAALRHHVLLRDNVMNRMLGREAAVPAIHSKVR